MKKIILLLIVLILSFASVKATLVSNMTFNTADGVYNSTVAEDLAMPNLNWSVHGATLKTGYIDEAYYFDGNDEINRTYNNFDVANAWSIGYWFYTESPGGDDYYIDIRRPVGGGGANLITVSEDTNIYLNMYDNGGVNKKYLYGDTPIQANTWYFVVVTWDGTNPKIYLNGVEDTPYTYINNDAVTQANDTRAITMGSSISGAQRVVGYIDQFFAYDFNMSHQAILALFNNQTQGGVGLFDCFIKGNNSLTINIRNESDSGFLTADIEGAFNYTFNNTKKNYSFSNTAKFHEICIFPEVGYDANETDYQIYYTYNDVGFTYFAKNITLTNVNKILNLYVTEGTTQTLFNIKDDTGLNIENAYITINKFDIGTNTYKTSEVLKTDSQGNAVGNIVLSDAWYKIYIETDDVIRLIDGPTIFTTNTRNYRINLEEDYYDSFSEYLNIFYNLTFNNATKNYRLDFIDNAQGSDFVCLKVERLNLSGKNLINETCLTSFSGTILSSINVSDVNGSTFLGTAYAGFPENLILTLDTLEYSFKEYWTRKKGSPQDFLIPALMLILALGFVGFTIHPIVGVSLTALGAVSLFFIDMVLITYTSLILVIVLAVIAIWRINRAR